MKIIAFIAVSIFLYNLNNDRENCKSNPTYHFYQKLSKIDINKDTTLDAIIEKISDTYQKINEEMGDINFTKHCEEKVENLSKHLFENKSNKTIFKNITLYLFIEKFKTLTFSNVLISIEQIGEKYQKNISLHDLPINFQQGERKTIEEEIKFQFNKFYANAQIKNKLSNDNIEPCRLKNFFYGAYIALDENISMTINHEKIIDSFETTARTFRIAATLFHHIQNAQNLFDREGNYIPEKSDLKLLNYFDFYRLIQK
jgi:hypothetical protein